MSCVNESNKGTRSRLWNTWLAVTGLLIASACTGFAATELEQWMADFADDPVRQTASDGQYVDELEPLLTDASSVPAKLLQWKTSDFMGSTHGHDVWMTTATADDVDYTLGARRRGEAWQPLYFCATGWTAKVDATFDEARERALSVVLDNETDAVEVSAVRTLAYRDRMKMTTWQDRGIAPPWDANWVFMVDDAPSANWAHPCRYVFVSSDLSAVAVRYAVTPLTVQPAATRSTDEINELEVIIPFVPTPMDGIKKKRDAASPTRAIRYDGNVSNCYAVIVSGGYNKANNHIRYWGDASFIYSTLTLKYGYPKTNVFALISDGLDPAIDRSDDSNSPTDLDGDGVPDTYASATAGNVSNVFVALQTMLQTNDQLFVFFTDHGGPQEDGDAWDVELNLWNREVLLDTDLKALTETISCPVFFAMEQCYSGGFLNDLNQTNRAIATAAQYNESSYAGETFPYFNQWAYHWTAAMRGFYPQTNAPWIDTEPCDADSNDDGAVSFKEAAEYATAHKASLDHPMYAENPELLGQHLFLPMPDRNTFGVGELAMDAVPSRLLTNLPFAVRITAKNVFGDVITNYDGEATLWADAPPLDPGEYVGTGTKESEFPFYTYYCDARSQVIYPSSLLGSARTLDGLTLNIIVPPPDVMSNFTIRVKHTSLTSYGDAPQWETNGWITAYASNLTLSSTGWVTFAFSEPFDYNGRQSLMVDFSFFNDDYYDGSGMCQVSEATNAVSIAYASDNGYGDPLIWSTNVPNRTTNLYPNLRFGPPPVPVEVQVEPTNLTGFVDGVWTGMVTALTVADGVILRTSDTEHSWQGNTGMFDILSECLTNYVDAASTNPIAPYMTWATAATNIQEAVDAANDGATVLVGDGEYDGGRGTYPDTTTEQVYLKSRVFITNNITLRSVNGAEKTIIYGEGPDGTNAMRCVYMNGTAAISGFTLSGGHVAEDQDTWTRRTHTGGGLFIEDQAVASDCIITDCTGSGASLWGSTNGVPSMRSCFVADNQSSSVQGGGGVLLDGGSLVNCSIINNRSVVSGGGIYVTAAETTQQVVNCIMYHNEASFGSDVFCQNTNNAASIFQNNCSADLLPGEDNITDDPLMIGVQNPHIAAASPCRGAGSPRAAQDGEKDIDGEARLGAPNLLDIGCDQYHADAISGTLTAKIHIDCTNVVAGTALTLKTDNTGKAHSFVWQYNTGSGMQSITNAWQIQPVLTNAGLYSFEIAASNADGTVVYAGTVNVVDSFTNYVSASGSHTAPFTSWSTSATNVQSAIDACYAGGVTVVGAGTYMQGSTISLEKPVTLCGAEDTDWDDVILDGENRYGVLLINHEDAVVHDLTLTHGNAAQGGGALVYAGTLRNSAVEYNTAMQDGGGIRALGDAVIHDCYIANNVALQRGGGLYADDRVTADHCSVISNTSRDEGGGIWLDQEASLNNCFIRGNRAYGGGGAAVYAGGVLRNCTLTFNIAEGFGGGIWHGKDDTRNCIIYYNEAPECPDNYASDGECAINCCLTTPGVTGTGNITNAEPLLAGRFMSHILPVSPARNAGDATGISTNELDVDREGRMQDGFVDMGCDEVVVTNMTYPCWVIIDGQLTTPVNRSVTLWSAGFGRPETLRWDLTGADNTNTHTDVSHITPAWSTTGDYPVMLTASNRGGVSSATVTVHVVESGFINYASPSGLHVSPFTTWYTAATNIQDAINACAVDGSTLVGPGVYSLRSTVNVTKPMTLAGVPTAENVVLDAGGRCRVMQVNHTNAVVHTMTLTGGADYFSGGLELLAGTVSNVTISGNTASNGIGGVNIGGSAQLIHAAIISNRAPSYAGGRAAGLSSVQSCTMLCNESSGHAAGLGLEQKANAVQCVLSNNTAGTCGGGLYLYMGGTAEHCMILKNNARQGAGAYLNGGGTLRSCVVQSNRAEMAGGVAVVNNASGDEAPSIQSSTITGNAATETGGMYIEEDGIVRNTIIYGNSDDGGVSEYAVDGIPDIAYSCTTPDDPSFVGMVTNDPQLISSTDLRLQSTSPCINSGINASWMTNATDITGNARQIGSATDMGSCEYLLIPTNLVATTNAPGSSLKLTWDAITGAASYLVYRSTNDTPAVLGVAYDGAYTDTTAQKEVSYTYWIAANYGIESSAVSSPAVGWIRRAVSLEWLLLLLE